MKAAHEPRARTWSTVAVRRVDLKARGPQNLLDHIDTKKIFILPNTAACYTAEEALRTARLGREAGLSNWVKLEVIGDEKDALPDVIGLLEATRSWSRRASSCCRTQRTTSCWPRSSRTRARPR